MNYTPEMLASMKKVEAAREKNIALEPRRLTAEEKEALLKEYHPDYKDAGFTTIRVGGNKGQKAPVELNAMLEAHSRLRDVEVDLSNIAYDVDVLV
ncbi:MAG: succinate dehydrogenase/fumarate reductase flavoprotein subunit, partial [Clostridia bacterium]|nr:succinate dehydrogenase/fumarate reductase flavoprotein subunit [Clostridia bacterium]